MHGRITEVREHATLSTPVAAVLVLSMSVAFSLIAQADENDAILKARYGSFISAGYDPLTAPPEWYDPTETVHGGDGQQLPRAKRGQTTVASTALRAASDYAKEQASTSLIVVHRGVIQLEQHWRDDGPDSYFNPQSMSKSVLALMVGAAIADGYIGSVSDPVSAYVEEWRGQARGEIRIHDLLQMASGLQQISGEFGDELVIENPGVAQHFGSDFHAPILKLDLSERPATKFDYNNNATNLLGIIVERSSGRRYAEYLAEKLWKPLGLRAAKVYLDRPGGHPLVACCILSRPMDWAKLGLLVLQEGAWEHKQIIPKDWIAAMLAPSNASPSYGYQIWLGNKNTIMRSRESPTGVDLGLERETEEYAEPVAADDVVTMRGFGFQRVWIIPSRALVIVRGGKSWPAEWDDAQIPNVIIRGILD